MLEEVNEVQDGTLYRLIQALKEKGYSAEDILDILERITQTKHAEKPKG